MRLRFKCLLGHKWSEWSFGPLESCEQIQICQRCGKKNSNARTIHSWGGWAFDDSSSCLQHKTCERCKIKSTESIHVHEWLEWKSYAQFAEKRTCKKCKVENKNIKIHDHVWRVVESDPVGPVYFCGGPCCDVGAGGSHQDRNETEECELCGERQTHFIKGL